MGIPTILNVTQEQEAGRQVAGGGPETIEFCRVKIASGADAEALLRDPEFQRQWRLLHQSCPWATSFQGPDFVLTWYRIYRGCFEPVLVTGWSTGGELVGLLMLAIGADRPELAAAGAWQAEYQCWLSSPACQESFIKSSVCALSARFRGWRLRFHCLPAAAPVGWTVSCPLWRRRCQLHVLARPLMQVEPGGRHAASLRKKSNKSRLSRLRRLGEVRLERITDPAALAGLLDRIIENYDLRMAALSGTAPFREDPQKKAFYLGLMEAGLLHVTVLWAGRTLVSAHLGFIEADTVGVGVLAYSPFHAENSPSKLHLLLLAQQLAAQGFAALDLTPGGEYKERFATSHERVYSLTVFFSRKQFLAAVALQAVRSLASRALARLGVRPHSLKRFAENLRSAGPCGWLRNAFWRLGRGPGYQVFGLGSSDPPGEGAGFFSRDSLPDLLAYAGDADVAARKRFFLKSWRRLQSGCHAYARVESGCLSHWCWLAAPDAQGQVPEIGREYCFPSGSAVLFDVVIPPEATGGDQVRAGLLQIAQEAKEMAGAERLFVIVRRGDTALRRQMETLGLQRVPAGQLRKDD